MDLNKTGMKNKFGVICFLLSELCYICLFIHTKRKRKWKSPK